MDPPGFAEKIRKKNEQYYAAKKLKQAQIGSMQESIPDFKPKRSNRRRPKPMRKRGTYHSKSVQPKRQRKLKSRSKRRRSSDEFDRLMRSYALPMSDSSTASKTQPDNDVPDFKPGKTKILSKVVYDKASIYDEYIGYDLYLKEMNMQSWNKKEIVCSFHMDFIPDMQDVHDYVCQYGNVKFIQYENYVCDIGPPKGVTIGRIVFLQEPTKWIFAVEDKGNHVMENGVGFRVYKSMNDFEMTKYETMKRRKERKTRRGKGGKRKAIRKTYQRRN